MMKRYIDFLDRFKWLIAFAIPLLVLALSVNLKHLAFEGDYRIWFDEDSKLIKDYDAFRQIFGNDTAITVAFRDEEGIFTPRALQTIDTITQKMWRMHHIARVDSLTNFQHVHVNPEDRDDVLVEDFIQNIDNLDLGYLQKQKEIALNDRDMIGSFISKDGKTTMIIARLTPKVNDDGDKSFAIMAELEEILKPLRKETGYRFWLNGGPPLNTSFVTIAQNDGGTFTPLVIFTVLVLLYALFRRVSGALIPMGVVVFTFLTVLSIQVLLGYKLNNFTANIPVFIVAIGIADAVHVYIVWLMYRREGKSTKEAVYISMQKNMLPIFLTSLTTAIGFASLGISHVVPVRTLGIATASGAILAFLISVFWMPSVLLLLKKEIRALKQKKQKSWIENFGYGHFIVSHDKKIILVTLAIFSLLAIGLFKVKVDSNTIRYFAKEVEIRKSTDFLQENLTGPMAYEIVVDSGRKNGIKDPKFLETVQRFYTEYQAHYHDIRHMSSLMDVIKRFNLVLNQHYTIPKDQNLVAQYLLLYSLSLPQGMEINDKMDIEERLLRVTAQVNIVDTSKDLEMIAWAEKWWENTPYKAAVNGQTKMFAHMQKDVTDTLIYSMSIAIVLVSIVMFLIFRNLRLIWVFLIPNILPIALVLGVMGWLGINIDLGVAVSGAIILGVAVDDTIHFLVKYFEARKKNLSIEEAFDYVLKYAGQAILFTTVILSVAFAMFMGSKFTPNFNFGIVTAIALIIAFIVDIVLLPALLSVSEKKEKRVV
jgi:hydrophobe/amphiphile efflux-3 (HAE3) family protein